MLLWDILMNAYHYKTLQCIFIYFTGESNRESDPLKVFPRNKVPKIKKSTHTHTGTFA
jgi:hypothetical protein